MEEEEEEEEEEEKEKEKETGVSTQPFMQSSRPTSLARLTMADGRRGRKKRITVYLLIN